MKKTILAAILLFPSQAHTFECPVDSVQFIESTPKQLNGQIAAADVKGSRKLILYDPAIRTLPKLFQDHIWAHECAHHKLGHLTTRQTYNAAMGEFDADCEAVKMLKWSEKEVEELITIWQKEMPESIYKNRSIFLRQCLRFN